MPFLPKPENLGGLVGAESEFDPLGFSDTFDVAKQQTKLDEVIYVPTPPGIKKHPTFVSLSVWLQLMVCKTCGRPLTSLELCAGCRSLARTRWLWETRLKGGDDSEPLSILRNCEGALTDIGEVRHCREAEAAPASRRDNKAPPKETPKAEVKEAPVPAPEAAGVPVPPKEEAVEGKERVEEDSYEEEVESEEPEDDKEGPPEEKVEDQPEKREEKPEEVKVKQPDRWYRGSLAKPLGLSKLPKQLSPRDGAPPPGEKRSQRGEEVPGRDIERKSGRREDHPSGSLRSSGHRRPQSPEPLQRHHPTRERSRSRRKHHKKNKGKRKRERGKRVSTLPLEPASQEVMAPKAKPKAGGRAKAMAVVRRPTGGSSRASWGSKAVGRRFGGPSEGGGSPRVGDRHPTSAHRGPLLRQQSAGGRQSGEIGSGERLGPSSPEAHGDEVGRASESLFGRSPPAAGGALLPRRMWSSRDRRQIHSRAQSNEVDPRKNGGGLDDQPPGRNRPRKRRGRRVGSAEEERGCVGPGSSWASGGQEGSGVVQLRRKEEKKEEEGEEKEEGEKGQGGREEKKFQREASCSSTMGAQELVNKLGNLVSVKGEDILLVNKTSEQAKYHRLRASVPSKLWVWKIIAGWQWKGQQEHINVLEMRAILASLQWKLHHKQLQRSRFIHLTDSMVCLHSLSRGRSSSRKLRRTLCRINALFLVSGCQGLWGYVHTDSNPADRPSRWGRRVKTKFRNG